MNVRQGKRLIKRPWMRSKRHTADAYWKWRELQKPNPEHVKKLREGIAAFRDMLEQVSWKRWD